MGNNTFNNTFNKEASVAQGDNATANQYIYANNSKEINKNLEELFEKFDDKQNREMNELTLKFFDIVDKAFVQTKKFNETKIEEFEEVKTKFNSDLKFKVKQTIPLSWFIQQFTGFSFEVEKEWKISQEKNPDAVLEKFRNFLYGDKILEKLLTD